ncbi:MULTISPECIES: hypothetical protein [Streptomyces]|uniref:hypothetical protein n=1 Tax=Streptomyces TaxID=1883 RepID=UPI000C25B619|nr:hypothetical protein [Streptomyces sp. TSRI0384-2]NEE27406.1 hypothetical protein [Streptomyces sp. SID7982]PJM82026.1 hypothetical protein CH313_18885 [Streptomyces sp. TSRI0384-2]
MNRRTLPALTALATATALLLTGCGGESSDPDDKIAGAGENSAEASASPGGKKESEADKLDRPEMKFPDDFTIIFDWEKPSDPDGAAALGDAENYVKAIHYGIIEQDPESAAYKFYIEPMSQAHTYAKDQIQQYVDGGWSLMGELRNSNVKVVKGKAARSQVVTFCRDESKAFGKDVKTGKKVDGGGGDPNDSHYAVTLVMRESKSIDGYWRAVSIDGVKGAAECV